MEDVLLDGGICRYCNKYTSHIILDDLDSEHGICMQCVVFDTEED
jgi:hypothetical protein